MSHRFELKKVYVLTTVTVLSCFRKSTGPMIAIEDSVINAKSAIITKSN